MKKHFLRTLIVMLMACLGLGVLAACGGDKEKDPPATTYTVAFSLGESHAASGVTAPASQTGKKVGDTVTLTTLEAAENYKFDGWSAKSGKVSGTTYTVKAEDAVEGTITLTAQWAEDTSAPTVEGIWTGIVLEKYIPNPRISTELLDVEVELSVKLNNDATEAYVAMKLTYEGKISSTSTATETYHLYFAEVFAKQEDGTYTDDSESYILELDENDKLTLTYLEDSEPEFTESATTQKALSTATAITLTGVHYEISEGDYTGRVFDFTQNKITLERGGAAQDMTVVGVGEYLFVVSADGTFTTAIYKEESTYFTIEQTEEPCLLTTTAPTPFAGYTIEYNPGTVYNAENMPEVDPENPTKYQVGQQVNVGSAPIDPEGRTFKYWIVGEDENQQQITAGSSYTVRASDEERGTPGTITLTAVWTKLYTVQYISSTADGEPDEATVLGTDNAKHFEGTAFDIITEEPTRVAYVFGGWKLYVRDWSTGELQKVSDTVYDKDENDTKSYNPTGTEAGEDPYEPIELVFVAQWSEDRDTQFNVNFSFGTADHHSGSSLPSTVQKKVGEEITFDDPTAETGWSFGGWFIGDKKVTSPYTLQAADVASDSTVTITARWKSDTDNYSGIWTKEGEDSSVVIALDAGGESGHMIRIDEFGGVYYIGLTKGSDNYTGTYGDGDSVTVTYQDEKLTVVIDPQYGDDESAEYDTFVPLGEHLTIPNGSYVADFSLMSATILLTFNTSCSYKMDMGYGSPSDQQFEPIYVGKYIVVKLDDYGALVVYQSGNSYTASYSGLETTLTAPGSSTGTEYEGVWTDGGETTITVKYDSEKLHVVVKTAGGYYPDTYAYYELTAGLDGFKYSGMMGGSLALSLHGTTLTVKGLNPLEPTLNFTKDNDAHPETLTLHGVYTNSDIGITIDFDSKTVDMGDEPASQTFTNVGDYIVVATSYGMSVIVYKTEDGVKVFAGDASYDLTLTEINLEEITATNWATKVYQYPENIKVGDTLTLTGDLTLTRETTHQIYDGVQIALSKTNFTDHATFCYDWRVNAESGKYTELAKGYLNCTIAGQWDTVAFPSLLNNGTGLKLKAVVSYPIATQVQIVYTITATVSDKEETYTITHVYYGVNGEEVSVGLAGEAAKLNNGKFVASKIPAPEIENEMAQKSVTIGTSKTSGYGTDTYEQTIKPGQTLTVTGNLQTDVDSGDNRNWAGFGMELAPYGVSNLIHENAPFNFRIDNACSQSDGWAADKETSTRYNLSIAKHYEGTDAENWDKFVTEKKDITVTVTVAWTQADQILITMQFTGSDSYTRTQTYTVTPMAEGSHLANAYTIKFSPDVGYIANAQAQVTYSAIGD